MKSNYQVASLHTQQNDLLRSVEVKVFLSFSVTSQPLSLMCIFNFSSIHTRRNRNALSVYQAPSAVSDWSGSFVCAEQEN